jgi:hypothetical protein
MRPRKPGTTKWTERLSVAFRAEAKTPSPVDISAFPEEISRILPEHSDLPRRFTEALRMVAVFREQLQLELEPMFRELLQQNTPNDLLSRRSAVYFLNKVLRENNLAICHPQTGEPCTLVVNTGSGMQDGRICLQPRKIDKDGHRALSVRLERANPETGDLPVIRLMVAPRKEGLSQRNELRGSDRS